MAHSTFFIKDTQGAERIMALENFLLNLPGVERALVDVDDGEVKIEYNDNEIKLNELAQNIEFHGFHIQ